MLNSYFRKLTDEEKHHVIKRLAFRMQTTTNILTQILADMNPLIFLDDEKVLINKYTLERLEKKIKEERTNKL